MRPVAFLSVALLVAGAALAGPPAGDEEQISTGDAAYRAIRLGGAIRIMRGAALDDSMQEASLPPLQLNPDDPYGMITHFETLLPEKGALDASDSLELVSLGPDSSGSTVAVYRQLRRGVPIMGAGVRVTAPSDQNMLVSGLTWTAFQGSEGGLHGHPDPATLFQAVFTGDRILTAHSTPRPILFVSATRPIEPAWLAQVRWTHGGEQHAHWDEVALADDDGAVLWVARLERQAIERRVFDDLVPGVSRRDYPETQTSDLPTGNPAVDKLFEHLGTAHESAWQLLSLDATAQLVASFPDNMDPDDIDMSKGFIEAHAHGNCGGYGGNACYDRVNRLNFGSAVTVSDLAGTPWGDQLIAALDTPDSDFMVFDDMALDLDIVAHEFSHLMLQGERLASAAMHDEAPGEGAVPGEMEELENTSSEARIATGRAIDESLADIFATAVSLRHGNPGAWAFAESTFTPDISGDALRSVATPANNVMGGTHYVVTIRCPSSMSEDHAVYRSGSPPEVGSPAGGLRESNCDAYYRNGSFISLAFRLLADGGHHPDAGQQVAGARNGVLGPTLHIEGLGWERALKIFFGAARNGLPKRNFREFRDHTVAEAMSMDTATSLETVISTCKAWAAVGLASSAAPCSYIPGRPVDVEVVDDLTENGTATLSWSPVASATYYRIRSFMHAHEIGLGSPLGDPIETSANVVFHGNDRWVRVQACNEHTCGDFSGPPLRLKGTTPPSENTSPTSGGPSNPPSSSATP